MNVMVVVGTREFRTNQSKYLNMVNAGEHVVLKSRSGNFRIVPIGESDIIFNRHDLAMQLRGALQEVKDAIKGEREMQTLDSLINEL